MLIPALCDPECVMKIMLRAWRAYGADLNVLWALVSDGWQRLQGL